MHAGNHYFLSKWYPNLKTGIGRSHDPQILVVLMVTNSLPENRPPEIPDV
jgi:hypothetical protein